MTDPTNAFPEGQVGSACEQLLGYRPKMFQMEAAKALCTGRDTIVISPTGSGKSLVIRLPFLSPNTSSEAMMIVVTPLKALQKEQVERDSESIYINAVNKNPELLKRIKEKAYRKIYMGPEQLQCDDVRKMLKTDEWAKDLLGFGYIVDEAHVVVQWGTSFRPVCDTLSEIRHTEARRVPLLAMSATGPISLHYDLVRSLQLHDPVVINVGSRRDNIFIKLRPFAWGIDQFQDIWEEMPEMHKVTEHSKLICVSTEQPYSQPSSTADPATIPKTIIYLNDKRMIKSLAVYLNKRTIKSLLVYLRDKMPTLTLKLVIDYHHGSATNEQRDDTEKHLAASKIRVAIATDSLGMSVDIPDIQRVIQVRAGDSIAAMVQRIGRAGRNGVIQAEGIVLFEKHLLKPPKKSNNQTGNQAANGQVSTSRQEV